MSDMKEAMREAQAHATLVRRAERDCEKQTAAAIERAKAARDRKIGESLKALSPAAARIVVAAQGNPFHEAAPSGYVGEGIGEALLQAQRDATPDTNPAPDWLNKEPAPLPAGALLEVADKPRKRA